MNSDISTTNSSSPTNSFVYGSTTTDGTPEWLEHISFELALLELLVHPVSMLVTVFNFIMVFNSAVLHTNLKWVLLAQSVTSCVLLSSVYIYMYTFRFLLSYVLLAERTLATVLFHNYVQYDKVWMNICWLAVTVSLSYVVQMTQDSSSHDFNSYTLPSIIVLFALQFAAFWTLKQRFQLSENIRTLTQLQPTFIFFTANVLLIYGIKFLFIFEWIVNDVPTKIAFMCQTLLLASVNIGIELTVITRAAKNIHHPMIKRKAAKQISKLTSVFRKRRVADVLLVQERPKNLFGDQLIINTQKPDDYFKMLERSWH